MGGPIPGPIVTGQKRTAEGTTLTSSNSFSVLDYDEIIARSNKMGVNIDDSCLPAIDLLKHLEVARCALSKKHVALNEPARTSESMSIEASNLADAPDTFGNMLLEWETEETSEVENDREDDFTLITSKRSRKPVQRLSLSGKKLPRKSKENPRLKRVGKGNGQGIHGPPKPAPKNKNKQSLS